MSFWERTLREDLTSAAFVRNAEEVVVRRRVVEDVRPAPPSWLRSRALEPGFVRTSPTLLAYAHALVHDARGVAASKIPHVFSTVPWMERTALRTQDDLAHEARRFVLLLDAATRSFLPAVYIADGNDAEAHVLQKLPQLHTIRAVVIATKVIVGFYEAELRNVNKRAPAAHVLFATVLRELAKSFIGFDQIVKAARVRKIIPPIVLVEMVGSVLVSFWSARRTSLTDTLDDYAIAQIGLMSQLDTSLLADMHTTL